MKLYGVNVQSVISIDDFQSVPYQCTRYAYAENKDDAERYVMRSDEFRTEPYCKVKNIFEVPQKHGILSKGL